MKIDTDSDEMQWILLKFLRDSLDFLSDDPEAKMIKRSDWAKRWMVMNLEDLEIKKWMPKKDFIINKDNFDHQMKNLPKEAGCCLIFEDDESYRRFIKSFNPPS